MRAPSRTDRRIVALEEHFSDPGVMAGGAAESARLSPRLTEASDRSKGAPFAPDPAALADLGEGRISAMDASGIAMQVLSSVSTQVLPAATAVELTRAANDRAAHAVREHPTRFAAFASIPSAVPRAAADELARCVEELGFVGTMVMGRTEDEFLDAPRFAPVLDRLASLDVPLYLHPGPPPPATSRENYEMGLDPLLAARFQTSAWGWHTDTAVHFIRLVLSGVLDRHPGLVVILGHWGEMVPYYMERIEESLPRRVTGLDREFSDYLRQNVYVTPSGMWSQAQLRFCADVLGTDRIMFSVDYPFLSADGATGFLDAAELPEPAKSDIAHGTAARLLGLDLR